MQGLVIVVEGKVTHGSPDNGLVEPTDEFKKIAARTGGKIMRAVESKPPINTRMQTYGAHTKNIGVDRVEYNYPVVEDKPTQGVRNKLIDATKAEAEKRALDIAPYWKQINAITDPDPDLTARIKAVRDASDQLEADIKVMDRDGLAAVNIARWSGWPTPNYITPY